MRHLLGLFALMMISAVSYAQSSISEECHIAVSNAAKAFAPSLSGGRCYNFIEVEGSLTVDRKIPGKYTIRVRTQNGSCNHNIWVRTEPLTCQPKSAGEVQ